MASSKRGNFPPHLAEYGFTEKDWDEYCTICEEHPDLSPEDAAVIWMVDRDVTRALSEWIGKALDENPHWGETKH